METTSYKDLNVYQKAYKSAIDLHQYLDKAGKGITDEEIRSLKESARQILGNIAEGFSQRTPKAKRFFNFKALDIVHRLVLDITFLADTQRFDKEMFKKFYDEYEQVAKELYKTNQGILEKQEQKEMKELCDK